jgi:hypothetical protein
LTPNRFGGLTGTVDHWTLAPHDGPRPDDNHIYLWIKVAQGAIAGKYEAAVNVLSSDKKKPGDPPDALDLRFCERSETVDPANWPSEGFAEDAQVSYAGLGLKETDFQTVEMGELRQLVASRATHCQRITVYGVAYPHGDGLHEVHMNSGNRPPRQNENRVNQDGAVVFYFDEQNGGPVARWIFLKFRTQDFPA